ncbi:MAG: GTP cyclohydrolase I FolE2 [Deferribacterales bacterium]|nr:GTP cyclohydrolase I FolE2 [Deferribacterales bacterium]
MLTDIQNRKDNRNIAIDRVGIKGFTCPIVLKDKSKGTQNTVAKINMSVMLPHEFKGTHMSRFLEVLNRHKNNISNMAVSDILEEMRTVLDSNESHIEMTFPYFIEKEAPVSKIPSLMDYECCFAGTCDSNGKDFVLTVKVPIQSLCPCSKEISDRGAHNQRSIASISVRFNKVVWIEELIAIAESSGSSPIYSLLKRTDEKFVTEQAYDNPAFVEDIVRNIAEKLNADDRITWYEISCENMESIHNHNAWAMISKTK